MRHGIHQKHVARHILPDANLPTAMKHRPLSSQLQRIKHSCNNRFGSRSVMLPNPIYTGREPACDEISHPFGGAQPSV